MVLIVSLCSFIAARLWCWSVAEPAITDVRSCNGDWGLVYSCIRTPFCHSGPWLVYKSKTLSTVGVASTMLLFSVYTCTCKYVYVYMWMGVCDVYTCRLCSEQLYAKTTSPRLYSSQNLGFQVGNMEFNHKFYVKMYMYIYMS